MKIRKKLALQLLPRYIVMHNSDPANHPETRVINNMKLIFLQFLKDSRFGGLRKVSVMMGPLAVDMILRKHYKLLTRLIDK